MASVTPAPPPYMSFGVFNSTVETFASSTVPTGPLDRRVLDGLSGADYGSLISGMRFLGLVDDDRRATQAYRDLVSAFKAGPVAYKDKLNEIIGNRYDSLIAGVDVEHGTISELEKAFKDAGVSQGQMLTKTVRFYIKALQEIGVTPSPHITKPKRPAASRKNGGDKPRQKTKKSDEQVVDRHADERKPEGVERLPIPGLNNAYIQYPVTLTEANCDLFEAMIGVLRTYVKGRSGKEKKP